VRFVGEGGGHAVFTRGRGRTPATTRPPRCSPSPRCRSPSRPAPRPVRSRRRWRWRRLIARLRAAGITFRVAAPGPTAATPAPLTAAGSASPATSAYSPGFHDRGRQEPVHLRVPGPGAPRGSASPLLAGADEVDGRCAPRDGVKPVFLSVGHRVSLDHACAHTLALTRKYRLPETTGGRTPCAGVPFRRQRH